MISTTGDQFAFYKLNNELQPIQYEIPKKLIAPITRITENCEPALCSVLFVGGAGGSLRAGVTENPVLLTQSVRNSLTNVTCGGAPAYIWPGGGITLMVDVTRMPQNSFGYVPTPALVAPIEFTMRRSDYESLGGHTGHVVSIDDAIKGILGPQNDHVLTDSTIELYKKQNPWPTHSYNFKWRENQRKDE